MKGCLAFFSEAPCKLSQTRRRLLQMSDFGALLTSSVRMLHCKSILRAMPGVHAGPARAMNAADFAPLRNAGRFCRAAALLLVQFYEIQDSLMNGRWVDGFNIF